MRFKMILAGVVILVAGAGAYVWMTQKPENTQQFALLNQEQQEIFAALESSDTRSMKVDSTNGPVIRVNSPSGFALASPVDFDIRVEPRGGVPVDMGSIRIEYRLGPAWINMTRTVLKYADIKGSHLSARGATLPTGKHAMRVSIQDTQKRKTQATVSFTVSR